MFRPFRSPRALGSTVVAIAMLVAGCHDTPTGPHQGTTSGTGRMLVYANMQQTSATTLVIQVTGPGIVKSDLTTPDTLTFNIPLTNGVASGTIAVPAGPQRVITAHAFNGVVETHRGSITTDIAEGSNPTVTITLLPLEGDQPITVSVGTTIVIVRPNVATLAIGDTLRMQADVRDQDGNLLSGVKVHWATLNPGRATIDTAGLMMVRDTGAVQIVATYGTVGGSAMITGTPASSQVAYQLTWNGTASAAWENANNWTPHGVGAARVPTLADSVVIPSGTPNQPVVQNCAPASVHDLIVQAGATLGSSCGYHVNVYGTADVRGSITAALDMRPGSHVAGHPGSVYVVGDTVSLADSATIGYLQVNGAPAKLMLAGHKLTVSGGLDVFGSGILQLHDGDTLTVYGDVNWQGADHTGFIDGGAVHFRGSTFYGYRYRATGTNTLYFDRTGTGVQTMSGFDFNSSTPNGIQRLTVTTPDGLSICSSPQIADTAKFVASTGVQAITSCGSYDIRSFGAVVTSANTNVSVYQWELRDTSGTSLVSGGWSPSYTDMDVAFAKVKPTLGYQALRFFSPNKLLANTAASQHVWVEGNGSDLDLNGHKLTVGDFMLFRNFATLTMTHAADTVLVNNYVSFEQDTRAIEGTKLTAGFMQVGSYMSGNGFNATGTHLVRFTGANPAGHYMNQLDYTSRTQGFANLEIAGTTPINMCGHVSVAGTLTVRAGATFDSNTCGGTQLRVFGDLVTEAGSSVAVYLVEVRDSAGTNHVAGSWTPAYTDFDLAGVPVNPALSYVNLRFFTSNKLAGNTRTSGLLWLDGAAVDLDLNGHTMTVGDYLDSRNGATLTMTHAADTLDIANSANFNGNTSAAEDTKLTAGVMRIGSYLYGYGFSASGTHKVIMRGTSGNHYVQSVDYPSRSYQGFANLVIDSGATVGIYNTPRVKSSMLVRGGAVLNNWASSNSSVRVDTDLVVEPSATVATYEIQLFNAIGTTHVQGAFTPTWTSVFTPLGAGALKPGLGYTNIAINAPVTLADSMTVNGSLQVNGAGTNLVLNGHRVHVLGGLDLNTNATVQMTNPADTMEVEGQTFWDGGGDHTTKLTAGTVILHGDRFCAGNYYGTGTHRTVLDRPSGQISVECIGSGGAQQLRNVDVKSGTAALNCWMWVTDTLHVWSGATVNEICGGGTLNVPGVLMADEGSAITNGPSYPSSNSLTVSFGDSSGTKSVWGQYDPAATYFTALNAYVNPSLHYRYMQIAQQTTLVAGGHLTVDGQLDIVNNARVRLNGSTLEVRKVLNFDNSAILVMDQPNDTVLASTADPTGPMYWDGGTDTTLTDGVIRFYGQRFVGTGFHIPRKTNNRFVFADTGATGLATIENNPWFSNLELAQTRGVQNYYSNTWVFDTLRVRPSVTLSAISPSYGMWIDKGGAGVYADAGSTVSSQNMHLQNPGGTKHVLGTWIPAATFFESQVPDTDAVNPALAYQYLEFDNGAYRLSGRTTAQTGVGVGNGANLNFFGNTLATGPAGYFDVWTNGTITQSTRLDSLIVGDWYRIQGNAGVPTITDGVTEVRGSKFEVSRDNAGGTLNHVDVLNGQGSGTLTVYTNSAVRAFQNMIVKGTRAVNLYYDTWVNGTMDVQTPVRVYGHSLIANGALSTTTGSTLALSADLHVSDPSGTSKVVDSLIVGNTMFFDGTGSQTIQAGSIYKYGNIQVAGRDTVVGGAINIPGWLQVSAGAWLPMPTGSYVGGTVYVYGTLNFQGGFSSPQNINVYNGGAAYTQSLSSTDFVDFNNWYVATGGTLDASTYFQNGSYYRLKTGQSPSISGTYTGPGPSTNSPYPTHP